jgi:hypothetical protein
MQLSRRASKSAEQERIVIPITELVYADLRRHAAEQRITVNRLSADLLAMTTGRPGLVRKLDPATLGLPALLARAIDVRIPHRDIGTRIRTEIDVAAPVYAETGEYAVKHAADTGRIAADLLALATGHPEVMRHLDRADLLRLAEEKSFVATGEGAGARRSDRPTVAQHAVADSDRRRRVWAHPGATYSDKDISPYFWPNGRIPTSEHYNYLLSTNWSEWSLRVEGLVATPITLSYNEIHAVPKHEQITQHYCIQG